MTAETASLLADLLLLLHFAFVAFVVLGLLLVIIGGIRKWSWVRHRLLRQIHLAAIGLVALQAWAGQICPLTTWENRLRETAGQSTYSETFVQHWLSRLIYFEAPLWVFTIGYTLFAGAVILTWFRIPPRRRGSSSKS